jgi:predicted amidophosphoribosyltransferase
LDYDFVAESLIHMYKECRQIALARLFGALMVRAGEPLLQQYQPIAWVPVPASAQRLRTNGFSPAQQIAQAVARRTGIACRVDWLRLTREGQAQKTLNRDQRVQAMIGRFAADPAVYGRCVGLIDDVITTGSTVAAAASAFKAAGARSVVVLAAARTPQRL